mmetsp:Transcript_15654/g.30908  ORF Transcript_15654/g.30908 Transcript_15654/m.30908 type:complete len:285 (+) Transcript_15654:462-1316(+)
MWVMTLRQRVMRPRAERCSAGGFSRSTDASGWGRKSRTHARVRGMPHQRTVGAASAGQRWRSARSARWTTTRGARRAERDQCAGRARAVGSDTHAWRRHVHWSRTYCVLLGTSSTLWGSGPRASKRTTCTGTGSAARVGRARRFRGAHARWRTIVMPSASRRGGPATGPAVRWTWRRGSTRRWCCCRQTWRRSGSRARRTALALGLPHRSTERDASSWPRRCSIWGVFGCVKTYSSTLPSGQSQLWSCVMCWRTTLACQCVTWWRTSLPTWFCVKAWGNCARCI